jgi:hypothetical protein
MVFISHEVLKSHEVMKLGKIMSLIIKGRAREKEIRFILNLLCVTNFTIFC